MAIATAPIENVWAPKQPETAAPLAPATFEETGLTSGFIAELALKVLYQKGQSTAQELADTLCVPLAQILQPALDLPLRSARDRKVIGGERALQAAAGRDGPALRDPGRTADHPRLRRDAAPSACRARRALRPALGTGRAAVHRGRWRAHAG